MRICSFTATEGLQSILQYQPTLYLLQRFKYNRESSIYWWNKHVRKGCRESNQSPHISVHRIRFLSDRSLYLTNTKLTESSQHSYEIWRCYSYFTSISKYYVSHTEHQIQNYAGNSIPNCCLFWLNWMETGNELVFWVPTHCLPDHFSEHVFYIKNKLLRTSMVFSRLSAK